MHRWFIACLLVALMAQAGWAEGETTPCGTASGSDTDYTITPCNVQNNVAFNMVIIGDSIAWGAGLIRDEKYSYLVAKWLSEQLSRPIHVQVLAHTGATLSMETSDPIRPPDLSSGNPTAFQQADEISNPNDVDLILVSAGINDVKVDDIIKLADIEGPVDNIKNWWEKGEGTCSVAEIRERSDNLESPMHFLLHKLLQKCPAARMIVTGYYPIISDDSKGLTDTIKALYPKSQQIGDYQNLDEPNQKKQLVEKSNTFCENSTESLKAAVNDAKSDYENDHVAFAQIEYNSDNSYGADQSLLWKIENLGGQIRTNDNMFNTRMSLLNDLGWVCACEQCITPPGEETPQDVDCGLYRWNKLAAVGHPNIEGAGEYNRSIVQKIIETWPDWLHPMVLEFEVSPPLSLTSGESFSINYKVSSNCSEGLKQVELWRKDESSDWQQISTNVLAGETGPLSGSFTDSPSALGKCLYTIVVVDNAGNRDVPTSFEPVEVEVKNDRLVTLTLYVHDGDANGPIIPDALVSGRDGSNKFFLEKESKGYVVILGDPGTWLLLACADGYESNRWDQEITETDTKEVYLMKSAAPAAQGSESSVVGKWKVHGEVTIRSLSYLIGEEGSERLTEVEISGDPGFKLYENWIYIFNEDGTFTASEYESCPYDHPEMCTNEGPYPGEWIQDGDIVSLQWDDGSTQEITLRDDTMRWTESYDFQDSGLQHHEGEFSAERISTEQSGNQGEELSDIQSVESWYNKGLALYAQGNYGEAITAFDMAIEINPQYASAWNVKADCLNAIGSHEEAIKAAERAIEIDPELPNPWAHKACALRFLGRYEEALNAIDRALEIDPNYAGAWYDEGTYLRLLGRTAEADAAFAKANELGYNG